MIDDELQVTVRVRMTPGAAASIQQAISRRLIEACLAELDAGGGQLAGFDITYPSFQPLHGPMTSQVGTFTGPPWPEQARASDQDPDATEVLNRDDLDAALQRGGPDA